MTVDDNQPAVFSETQLATEISEYLSANQVRRRLVPRAALIGLLAGSVAIVFRLSLQGMDALRTGIVIWARQYSSWGWVFPVAFGSLTAATGVWAVRRFAPEASGSGIPHLKAVLHRLRDFRPWRILIVKFIGGLLAMGSGMALGREGPTLHMGGAISDIGARQMKSNAQERLTLIAAGAGAGLAAAFNAPLAGFIFVLEEVQRDFRATTFAAALVAAAVADTAARFVLGQSPVFAVPNLPTQSLSTLPLFIVLGLLCGFIGVIYNRVLMRALNTFAKLRPVQAIVAIALVGGVAGLAAWIDPVIVGGGHGLTEAALAGDIALSAIPLLFLFRFVFMIMSYSTGSPGGIFAPMLVIGALAGAGIGRVGHVAMPNLFPQAEVFAVVGMAALFTAIVRAPLTGVVLIVEMTGSYSQMLPLLVACFCAYLIAERMGDLPVYEALLKRDLSKSGVVDLAEPVVVELEVQPGSLFDGRLVRELGLPAGCILVKIREGNREWLPTASTRLGPHQRLTALIGPEAESGLEALHAGCEGRS